MKEFAGKVALVTGGASGIGRATALLLADGGASVFIGDVDDDAGRDTVDEIRRRGGEAAYARTDVTDAEQCEALVRLATRERGRLDIAFNNAGIMNSQPALMADTSPAAWSRILDTNLTGVFNCMRFEIPAMQQHGGAIVNTASIAGYRGILGSAAYCASKHGVIGLTRAAALEYGRHRIRINVVCPGYTETPMLVGERATVPQGWLDGALKSVPLRRLGDPVDVAEMVVWLCSSRSAYVTGARFSVDGGLTAA